MSDPEREREKAAAEIFVSFLVIEESREGSRYVLLIQAGGGRSEGV